MVTTKITPKAASQDEALWELTRTQQDLTEAMQRLIRFQRQTLVLKNSQTMDAALDTMESLLIEVIDFAYASLQQRIGGSFSPLRQICPEGITLDYPLMEWVMGTQEVSVLPIELPGDNGLLRSLILLPFGAHHIMLLWLEQSTDAFTQEQEALLSILSREMAAVLDAHHYRLRLEKTRAAMLDIIESVPLGLVALDHRDRVQMINSTAEFALDVRRQAAAGADYHDALPKEVVELLDRAAAEGGAVEEAELSVGRQGQEGQALGITVSPMRSEDGSGGKTGQVVVCRDLRLSREVRKLRELDSMKNDFLSLVTHELRTPLTSIMAYSETLMMDASEAVPPEWREYITIIHNEGKRLCRLIDDVLDLTRMEAGKMEYDYEEQDPNELIGTIVMEMTPALEEKKLELTLDLAEDIGEVRMAVERFQQVLSTIASNAVKYTPAGGKIAIRSYMSEPFTTGAAPTVTIEVRDNGIGISPENIEKVFSKFEMVEAVQNHTAGTGLGLTISKRIVEEGHDGKIWLESELGKGTTVFVRVPVRAG